MTDERIRISEAEFSRLVSLQQAGNYTQFYLEQYRYGSAIAGLYATGNSAGNAFGRVYPGPGATIGQGLAYGFIAAKHAAGSLGN